MRRIINSKILSILALNIIMIQVSLSNTVSIPFKLINGLIVLNAEIDGRVGNFILDTGSSDILINQKSHNGGDTFYTSSGAVSAEVMNIKELRVGSIEKKRVSAYRVDLVDLEKYLDIELLGILGGETFAPKAIEINFIANELVVTDEALDEESFKSGHKVHFKNVAGVPVAEIILGGQAYKFILDSGATTHFIDDRIAKKHECLVKTGKHSDVILSGSEQSASHQWSSNTPIKIGNLNASHLKFYTLDMKNYSENMDMRIAGLISLRSLADHIFVDLKENVIYVKKEY